MDKKTLVRAHLFIVPNWYGGSFSSQTNMDLSRRIAAFVDSRKSDIVAVGNVVKTEKATAYEIPIAFRAAFYHDESQPGEKQAHIYETIPQHGRTVTLVGRLVPREEYVDSLAESEQIIAEDIEDEVESNDLLLESKATSWAIGDEHSVAYGVYVTRERDALANRPRERLSESLVISEVCRYFEAIPSTLISGHWDAGKYMRARAVAMCVISRALHLGPVEIGRIFRREHATVGNSLNKFDMDKTDPIYSTMDLTGMIEHAAREFDMRRLVKKHSVFAYLPGGNSLEDAGSKDAVPGA